MKSAAAVNTASFAGQAAGIPPAGKRERIIWRLMRKRALCSGTAGMKRQKNCAAGTGKVFPAEKQNPCQTHNRKLLRNQHKTDRIDDRRSEKAITQKLRLPVFDIRDKRLLKDCQKQSNVLYYTQIFRNRGVDDAKRGNKNC